MRMLCLLLMAIALTSCSDSHERPANGKSVAIAPAQSASAATPVELPQVPKSVDVASAPVAAASSAPAIGSDLGKFPPSRDAIDAWWKAKSSETVSFNGQPIEVRLRSKEIAYLIDATFDRGRNDMFRTVLVRPRLQEVREIDEPVATEITVYDLDRNGVSEVVAQKVGSGGGTWRGVRAIVQFDDWSPVVLYESEIAQTCEATTWNEDCYTRLISWKFVDIDGDGTVDLFEDVTTVEASPDGRPVTTKETHKLLFKKGDKFIE